MIEETRRQFIEGMSKKLLIKYDLQWDTDKKGVTCGWCRLAQPKDICTVAELVAGFKGRIMTISPMIPTGNPNVVEINYHFYFEGINCTVTVTILGNDRKIESITPILKSADWHEREMQELYNIKLLGHPNSKRLFLDKSINMDDHTMIPLSEAMNGASTNTLWEKITRSRSEEGKSDE